MGAILSKIGKGLERAAYIALIALAIKLILSIILGYVYWTPAYAGPVFYRWRKDFCDGAAAKDTYSFIEPNRECATAHFKLFSQAVQPKSDPKVLEVKIKRTQKELTKCTNEEKKAELIEKIKELQEKLQKDGKYTANGLTPLYSIGKFTDSFEIKPSKLYKIYDKQPEVWKADQSFLSFRYVFLCYLSKKGKSEQFTANGKKEDVQPKLFTSIKKNDVLAFFKEVSNKSITKGSESITINGETIDIKYDEALINGFNTFSKAYDPFSKLIKFLESNGEPICNIEEQNVQITDEFYNIVKEIVEALNLESLFTEKEKDLKYSLNEFIKRLCLLKPTLYDVRILNRFYYYYLYTVSYLEPTEEEGKANSSYMDLLKKFNGNDKSAKEMPTNFKDFVARREIFREKLSKKRVEFIFNKLSLLIANKLGKAGALLKPEDDKRNFILVAMGCYPKLYRASDMKKLPTEFKTSE